MNIKTTLQKSLALAASGDWQGAHALIDALEHPVACWLHASLHREEGDAANAGYWYSRAGRPYSNASFTQERATIATEVDAMK
ncbi:MAG: hypothetical protein SF187_22185 [Deltaproteobacteria bacterium]|nr:hypothetical protein [Deltaproteobacteria bacterium]